MSPEEITALVNTEIAKRIYEDGLSNPTKQAGEALTDIVKAVRLFTAPIQLIASVQDRLTSYLKDVSSRVPKEKQLPAEGFYSAQILEKLAYVDEKHYLKDMYLNLLEKAINKDFVNLAHPAFPSVISQLSPDEIYIIETIKDKAIFIYDEDINYNANDFEKVEGNIILEPEILAFPDNLTMYIEHLRMLNLTLDFGAVIYNRNQSDRYGVGVYLSDFGYLFLEACT